MKSFEEKRQEYLEKLKKYENYIIELSKEDKNKKMIEILKFPKDEEELNMASTYVIFMQDSIELYANTVCGHVEKVDLENSTYIEYATTIINLRYNNESVAKIEEVAKSYVNNPHLLAEIMYDSIVFSGRSPYVYMAIINAKCGINNPLEYMKNTLFIKQIHEKVDLFSNIDKYKDKNDMDKLISVMVNFHELCIKGIKQNSDSEVVEIVNEILGSDTDFEEKRQEYFKRLEENEELILILSKVGNNKQTLEILSNPKNEKELNFANKYLMFLQDYMELAENSVNGNIEEIDFNNCIFMDFVSDLTKLMYNNANAVELEVLKTSYDDINLVAEILYQMIIFATNPPENIDEIIENKCGIDINNEEEFMEFSKITENIKSYIPNNIIDENSMEKSINFVDKFHELCVNGIKKNSDSKHDELLDTLIDSCKQKRK